MNSSLPEEKLRIAWFSDLSEGEQGEPSLSRYCTDLLIPHLRDTFSIELFSSLYQGEHLGVPRFHYLTAYHRDRSAPFDLFFYQLEDSRLGRAVRTQIGIMPGITWVHDPFLFDPGAEGIHNSPWRRTVAQYNDEELPFVKRDQPGGQLRGWADRELRSSAVTLFSNNRSLAQFRAISDMRGETLNEKGLAEYLPMPVAASAETRPSRADNEPLSIVAIGGTGIEGRMRRALPALTRLSKSWRLTWIVDSHEREDAQHLLGQNHIHHRLNETDEDAPVTLLTGRSIFKWRELLTRSDVALHLGKPQERLSPFLELSMAAGTPVIVMKRALFDGALNDRVLSITSGTDESSQCFTFLARIAEDRGHAIGEKARQAIQRAHAPHAVALQLGELWNRFAPIIRKKSEQQRGLYAKAEAALEAEMKRLIDSEPPIAGDIFNTIVSTTLAEIQRFRSA
jgi:hypothetical protein